MLKKNLTPEIKSAVIEVYEKEKNISKTKDAVNELLNISLTFYNCKEIINGLNGDLDHIEEVLHEINDEIEEVLPYEVLEEEEGNYYLLEHKQLEKTYKLEVELIDTIFKDYSRHGNNLSGEEILQKYKLKPQVFSLIKSKLRLYKASDVISPFTAATSTEEDLQVKIDDAIDENLSRTKEKMVSTYDKKFKVEAKKAMKIAGDFEYRLGLRKEILDTYKPKDIQLNELELNNSLSLDVVITDLHIGKKNTDKILGDLERIKADIINSKEQNITLICLGDIGENFSEVLMHGGQHINLDRNIPTDPHELKLYIAELFQQFLIDIRQAGKNVSFVGLTGNHDRATSKNGDDMIRSAGLDVYEFIRQGLKNLDIEVSYFRESINTYTTELKHYILSHGEFNFNTKKPEDILWKYGKQDKFNLILSGHTHEHKQQVGNNFAKIVVAPLAGPNDYDERLGLKGEVGYTKIKDSEVGGIEIQNVILK